MELETVKLCFEKYMRFLEKSERINYFEKYNLDTMTIQDIDRLTQISFMDYTIKCDDKINQFSVPCTLYKHVTSLIRQYIQDEANKTISQLGDHIFKLEDENGKLKKECLVKSALTTQSTNQLTQNQQQQARGWFFY